MKCDACEKLYEENELCCAYCFKKENLSECQNCKIRIRNILINRKKPCPNFQTLTETIDQRTFKAIYMFIYGIDDGNSQYENASLGGSSFATNMIPVISAQEQNVSFSSFYPINTMSYNNLNGTYTNSLETVNSENRSDNDSELDTVVSDNRNQKGNEISL